MKAPGTPPAPLPMLPPTRHCGVRRRGAALATALVLAAGGALAGCGGDDHDHNSSPTPSGSSTTTVRAVPTHVRVAHVQGKLPKPARKRVTKRVGKTVDAWFEAAYLGGDYPRGAATFKHAFPGFTPPAVATARKRLGIMSNATIATRVDAVQPVTRLVALDVLAVKGRAVGVTARVKLVFRTTGKLVSRQVVRGQLDLTPFKGKWRVFAFDVTKHRPEQGKGKAGKTTTGKTKTGKTKTGKRHHRRPGGKKRGGKK